MCHLRQSLIRKTGECRNRGESPEIKFHLIPTSPRKRGVFDSLQLSTPLKAILRIVSRNATAARVHL